MIEPVRMAKIRITGSKRVLDDSVNVLHSAGVVHIDDYKSGKYKDAEGFFEIGSPFERAAKLSETLVRVRSLITALKVATKEVAPLTVKKDAGDRLKKLESTYEKLAER